MQGLLRSLGVYPKPYSRTIITIIFALFAPLR